MVWTLVEELLKLPSGADQSEVLRGLCALFCARGLVESGLAERVREQDRSRLDQVRSALIGVCEGAQFAVADRADAGDWLGALGDPRLEEPPLRLIPAVSFWMGAQKSDSSAPGFDPEASPDEGPVHRVEVKTFELARWPVTVGEFTEFVLQGGYEESRYWDSEGWQLCKENSWKSLDGWSEQLRFPSRPVVGVSWYEADAFARKRGARLPTEAEWERAARGPGGHRYPWGDVFDPSRCNSFEAELYRSAPVGVFPGGQTPEGVEDLSGNVWEWVEDTWHETYEGAPDDGSAWIDAGASDRVIRGGSWGIVAAYARAAFRSWGDPGFRYGSLGFRLARGPEQTD